MMKTLIAIVNPDLKRMFFEEHVLRKLETFSQTVWYESTGAAFTSGGLAEIIGDFDAVLTSWGSPFFTSEVLAKAEKLSFIGHVAGSATAVVDEAAYDKGICVVTANPILARSTAEAAVALIMAGAWDLGGYSARLKRGEWSDNSKETVIGLTGQTIGLIGLGEISRNMIGMLRGFSPKLKLCSHYTTEEQAAALGVELCSLDELLATSRIVSLHTSLTPSTVGLIGRRELGLIQDGALFVNTARGKIVDHEALLEELQTGRFFAALDVYPKEPLRADDPLLKLENVLCVPHIGGFARNCKQFMGEYAADNLKAFLEGGKPAGQVGREAFQRMTSSVI